MAESAGLTAARERLSAGVALVRRLTQHPRRHVAVDGGLLGFLLFVVCFDIRSAFAFTAALGVIALYVVIQRKERAHTGARADGAPCDVEKAG